MPPKPTRNVASAVVALLATQIALGVAYAVTLTYRIGVLHRIEVGDLVSQAQGNAADRAVRIAGEVQALVFLATVVVWCVWQHRAQRNAIELAVGGLRFTPGWAVGWWFVPFANLVKPFQAVRELWKASHGGDAWQRLATWPVIGWWWAIWLASNVHVWFGSSGFSVELGFGSSGSPTTLTDYISRDTWAIVSIAIRVAAAILAIVVVRAVQRLQSEAPLAIPPMPGHPGAIQAVIPPPPG